MILRLAGQLSIPVRERNALLVAAGYAPVIGERPIDDPALAPARTAIDKVASHHDTVRFDWTMCPPTEAMWRRSNSIF
jgi:hypothetical protein